MVISRFISCLCVATLVTVLHASSIITPPIPATLPLEGNSYSVYTPPTPVIESHIGPCEKKCGKDQECVLGNNEAGVPVGRCKPKNCLDLFCSLDCQWGYGTDSFGCPVCACVDPCENYSCQAGEKCERRYIPNKGGYKAVCSGPDHVPHCKQLECIKDCEYGYIIDKMGCKTCECNASMCGKSLCSAAKKCVSTHNQLESFPKQICIDKNEPACKAVLKNFNSDFVDFQCDISGAYKEVQILNGQIVCMNAEGHVLKQDNNCYTQGLLKVKVVFQMNMKSNGMKRKLSRYLSQHLYLQEKNVVVAKIERIGSMGRAWVLLLSNHYVSQQDLIDRLSSKNIHISYNIVNIQVYPAPNHSRSHWIFNALFLTSLALTGLLILCFFLKFMRYISWFCAKKTADEDVENAKSGQETKEKANKGDQYKQNVMDSKMGISFAPYKHLEEDV